MWRDGCGTRMTENKGVIGEDKKDKRDKKGWGSRACLWEMEAIDRKRCQSVVGKGGVWVI